MSRDPVAVALGIFKEKRTPRLTREELARVVCPVPDRFASSGEAERWRHRDLTRLDAEQLWREHEQALEALKFTKRLHPWVSERYRATLAELLRRDREEGES
jgi:hypothetical protein